MMETLKVSTANSIATVSLNRPELRNAFNTKMIQELTETFQSFAKLKDLRGVILRGEGKVFCAGGDLNWMQSMISYSLDENKKDSQVLFNMFEAIANCEVPVIGLVHGAAMGGAMGLVSCCDIVLAEEDTQFGFTEVKLGILPAVISAFVLRKTSMGLVMPAMLTGKIMTAFEVEKLGLVHGIYKKSEQDFALEPYIKSLHDAGPMAVRATKALLKELSEKSWLEQKALTTEAIAKARVSAEGQEGLKSFLEKRNPSWRGN